MKLQAKYMSVIDSLTDVLIKLGVDEKISEDACKIEHDISDESFNAIRNMYISVLRNKNYIQI